MDKMILVFDGHKSRWKHIEIEVIGGCWACTSHHQLSSGYYNVNRGDSHERLLHRYVYEKSVGSVIPKGQVIKHECDNKWCINPNHLAAGTQKENINDACARGLLKTQLTSDQVKAIRSSRRNVDDISERFGISVRTVKGIKRRKIYKWV